MADVFDTTQPPNWNFTAVPSQYLSGTVDVTAGATFADSEKVKPVHTAAWWAAQTRGFDWSKEDRVPADKFNRIIWKGFKGNAPYPAIPNADKAAGDND
jgi:hypothetical protein